jgi:catechol 1,2-dioxygenase
MARQSDEERSDHLPRRDLLRLLSATLPAAGLLGACSDGIPAGTDGGQDAGLRTDGGAAADLGPSPDARAGDGALLPDLLSSDSGPGQCERTGSDALGPFHVSGAPFRSVLAGASEPGERVTVSGVVYGPDCKTPLAGAIVDVWHADASGQYHTETTTYRLRGQMKTDAKGRYQFDTIRPGHYDKRPRHYHLIVSSAGHVPLTTQIYFLGDPYLGANDSCQPPTCNSGDPGRVVDFKKTTAGGKTSYSGSFDVVLMKM